MGLNTVQLESTIWVIVVVLFFIIVNVIFRCSCGSSSRNDSHAVEFSINNPMQGGAGQKADEAPGPTRYAVRDSVEVTYDDKENNRFYSTCSNDDIIKVTTIWSLEGEQAKIAYNEAYDLINAPSTPQLEDETNRATLKAEATDRIVELYKPLGLELAEDPSGQVYVKAIDRGSRAEQSGIIFVGDFVRMLIANIGEEFWNCREAGLQAVLNHIRNGNAPTVKLMFEASTVEEEKHRRRIAFAKPTPKRLRLVPNFLKDPTAGVKEEKKAFLVQCKTVPLTMATHVECEAAQYTWTSVWSEWAGSPNSTLYELVRSFFYFLYRLMSYLFHVCWKWLIVLVTAAALFAVVMCFYVPGYQELYGSDHNNYEASKRATEALFGATFCAFFFHILYIFFLYRSKKSHEGVRRWTSLAFILGIIVLAIAGSLVSLANGHGQVQNSNNDDKSDNGPDTSYSWNRFICGCTSSANDTVIPSRSPTPLPGNPTIAPSQIPTRVPTAGFPTRAPTSYRYNNDYAFECTNDLFTNVHNDVCQVNCGVCAPTYRNPFVAFAFLGAIYFAWMCFIMHYEFYVADQLDVELPKVWMKEVVNVKASDMIVTVHGSRAFGYPIYTKMSLVDYLPFEERINMLVQSEKERRSGDIMRHFASTGTYSLAKRSWFGWSSR